MTSRDIAALQGERRESYGLSGLLRRAAGPGRASWTDIPANPGIYVVHVEGSAGLTFSATAAEARHAETELQEFLQQKWERIQADAPTDIVYVGKGANLRKRVRQLARFGVGRAANHKGGEWMWQIEQIDSAQVLVQTCPAGREEAFEGELLDQFRCGHGDWPLANRQGGTRRMH